MVITPTSRRNLPMSGTTKQQFDWVNVRPMPDPVDERLIARFKALEDLSATVADALDALGIKGSVGSSTLVPTLPNEVVVGRAITLRNVPSRLDPYKAVT